MRVIEILEKIKGTIKTNKSSDKEFIEKNPEYLKAAENIYKFLPMYFLLQKL